jgi:Uma2 family endonuclease
MNLELGEVELPVRLRFERPVTDEELLRFCAVNEIWRVERDVNGELIVMTPTGSEGSGFETEITVELGIWARRDGRGRAFNSNAGFRLPDGSVRAADAHWLSWAKWNSLTREQRKGYAPICPEFVIEVRSESDRLAELEAKMEMWMGNGVEVGWLIDPQERAVTIYRAGEEAERLVDPSSVQGSGPVLGFELVMARIWDEPGAGERTN